MQPDLHETFPMDILALLLVFISLSLSLSLSRSLPLYGYIWCYLALYRAIWRYLVLSGVLSGTIWCYIALSRAIWCYLALFDSTELSCGPFQIYRHLVLFVLKTSGHDLADKAYAGGLEDIECSQLETWEDGIIFDIIDG